MQAGRAKSTCRVQRRVHGAAAAGGGFLPCTPSRGLRSHRCNSLVLPYILIASTLPHGCRYMTRLGLFGFKDASEMIELLSK